MATSTHKPPNGEDLRFVVGIDFGATASEAVVKFSGKFQKRKDLFIGRRTSQDTGGHATTVPSAKIPTRLGLAGLGNDTSKPTRWGSQVPDNEPAFRWFKVALLSLGLEEVFDANSEELFDSLAASVEMREARALRRNQQVSAAQLTEAYLRHFWDHIVKQIASQDLDITEDQVRASMLHVVIGIPAKLHSRTENHLQWLVKEAGIPGCRNPLSTIELCMEPEAAAVALVERHAASSDPTSGNVITVYDSGGGTADAASYVVTSTQPFQLEECVSGTGQFCGPVVLDGIFKDQIKNLVEMQQPLDSPKAEAGDLHELWTKLWYNGIKYDFDGSDDTWEETMPSHLTTEQGKRPGLRSGVKNVEFTTQRLKTIIDPTIEKILGLVRDQVKCVHQKLGKPPKSVFLSGGFSANQYLRNKMDAQINRLTQEYSGQHSPAIRSEPAPKPDNPWLVAMGCATKGYKEHWENLDSLAARLLVFVASRIARASFAIGASLEGPLQQFVTKGEGLPVAEPRCIPLHKQDFISQGAKGPFTLKVYEGQGVEMRRDTENERCTMTWTGDDVGRLNHAFENSRSVELGVFCKMPPRHL